MNGQSPNASVILTPELDPAAALLVAAIVGKHGSPAPLEAAEATIEKMRPAIEGIYPAAEDPSVFKLVRLRALQQITVDIAPPIVLAPDFEPWFNAAVGDGEFALERWYSYKQHLGLDKAFPPQVLDSIDQSSSEVVDLLGDPRQSGSWKRRGLVIGEVQSGKTATYVGIVNKAADAGYKLVVLLTGGTESLRKQTQFRVDEGFLGKDSAVVGHDKVLGVGHHPTKSTFLRGQGMTSYAKDFVSAVVGGQNVTIDPNADHPYVFVIKKNKTPLSNLIAWLSGQFKGGQFDIPMLVVDDESDYASINTNYAAGSDKSPTLINQKIRELLALTTRSSYMAFTATPFANVFIDHETFDEALSDDLFPHHYIYALSAPSNYMGASAYFGTAAEAVSSALVDIADAHTHFPPKHKSQLSVSSLPQSLEDAVRAFVVAGAIRLARGDRKPRSMLVNVSRFKHVQSQVFDLVDKYYSDLKGAIELHAQPPVSGPDSHHLLVELAGTFDEHFPSAGLTWPETRDRLLAAVLQTKVVLVNSTRDKSSDDKPQSQIAVGGDVLSRGLTLEGLTVSYFYRMVGAADTLLQMARWFGYRPGYEDLVRVWISAEVADQFRFVNDVSQELRDQIGVMRDLGRTPRDFGLLVRKHPESLAITAKRGVAETKSMVISLSGRRIETTKIPASPSVVRGNWDALIKFLKAMDQEIDPGTWHRPEVSGFAGKRGVPRERIADLLSDFRYDRGNLILGNSLDKIIRNATGAAFQDWTVGVVHGAGKDLSLVDGLTVKMPQRSVRYSPDASGGAFRVSGKSARLAGTNDLARAHVESTNDLVEPAVYNDLPHPTLLIYPLFPKLDLVDDSQDSTKEALAKQEQQAKSAWSAASEDGVGALVALKLAIKGEPGSAAGDVQYWLNGPAIAAFAEDYGVEADDMEDVDE